MSIAGYGKLAAMNVVYSTEHGVVNYSGLHAAPGGLLINLTGIACD